MPLVTTAPPGWSSTSRSNASDLGGLAREKEGRNSCEHGDNIKINSKTRQKGISPNGRVTTPVGVWNGVGVRTPSEPKHHDRHDDNDTDATSSNSTQEEEEEEVYPGKKSLTPTLTLTPEPPTHLPDSHTFSIPCVIADEKPLR